MPIPRLPRAATQVGRRSACRQPSLLGPLCGRLIQGFIGLALPLEDHLPWPLRVVPEDLRPLLLQALAILDLFLTLGVAQVASPAQIRLVFCDDHHPVEAAHPAVGLQVRARVVVVLLEGEPDVEAARRHLRGEEVAHDEALRADPGRVEGLARVVRRVDAREPDVAGLRPHHGDHVASGGHGAHLQDLAGAGRRVALVQGSVLAEIVVEPE
mmetsp:Transcript_93251/g.285399  ORF Transcript_93251/g.285399 Transcript_93251/m.285399 type:complete len:212 (-) Transcript_93251:2047-2682(-)